MDWIKVFNECLEHIRINYKDYHFYCEKDFVWTAQRLIDEYIQENNLPFKVYNDYPIEPGLKRSKSVDLAIVSNDLYYKDLLNGYAIAELVVEFKFEPSKIRGDEICVHKLPVVFWREIIEDVNRVKRFSNDKKAKKSIAIFVDEFGRYRKSKYTIPGSKWINWGDCGSTKLDISVLYTEASI